MLRAIPHVAAESCFALKDGTAINLFVRDMPRLASALSALYPKGSDEKRLLYAMLLAVPR